MSEWKEKPARELRDHDVLEHHGMVDWTVGYPHDQIAVHIQSAGPRRSYTLLIPDKQIVSYSRS